MGLTDGQQHALEELQAVAAQGDALEVLEAGESSVGYGYMQVVFTVRCSEFEHKPGGLRYRDRERFLLLVPPDFPFSPPSILVRHRRWAKHAHVQWGSYLCLYQAPATEWNPSDGMFGFLDRLTFWLRKQAAAETDPAGAPIHPPTAYDRRTDLPMFVPKANAPAVTDRPWLGLAQFSSVSSRRSDIVGWVGVSEFATCGTGTAVGVLLNEPLSWEFPKKAKDLLDAFEQQGITRDLLMALFWVGAYCVGDGDPLFVVVGTPMRGIAGSQERFQHLEVWHLGSEFVKHVKTSMPRPSDSDELVQLRADYRDAIVRLLELSPIDYCVVREDRPEVTERRDLGSPLEWFRGKAVSLWGCGALGGWIAEMLARAGVSRLVLFDKGEVAPGVLVRQPFDDSDIGFSKAERLRKRLMRIDPNIEVLANVQDVTSSVLEDDDWASACEIVVDATASLGVSTKLERVRLQNPKPVPVLSMIIGHTAERGLATVSLAEASGAGRDVVRRAKLSCASKPELSDFLDEFWPSPARTDVFQPEPGCSDATFRGSGAEVVSLATGLLTAAAADLARSEAMVGHVVALPSADHQGSRYSRLPFEPDVVITDGHSDYQIRLSRSALSEIRAWLRQSERTNGARVETGGLLFGERDEATRVIWVSEVTGPPPDSVQSEAEFVCGIQGTERFADEKRWRGRGSLSFVGMWHSHPGGRALPSIRDVLSMSDLVLNMDPPSPKSLALIVGGTAGDVEVGAYVFDRRHYEGAVAELAFTDRTIRSVGTAVPSKNVGMALSGGGSRAIAFHLGCLRALNDKGVLDRVRVISSVSGGSVLAAAWAYSSESFSDFDRRMSALLRKGLAAKILRRAVVGQAGLRSLTSTLTSGVVAICTRAAAMVLQIPARFIPAARKLQLEPPIRRFASRTDALVDTLRAELFGDESLTSPRRDDIDVVINACELRSGSAFRFGSKESSCWRLGTIRANEQVKIAEAVAASAAYPVFFPALDRRWAFVARDGEVTDRRVVLTDGGVYDNLGTTCLEPGRSPDYTYNIFPVDVIIACDAGRGLLSADPIPYFWISRLKRAFDSVFRKAQDSGRGRLYALVAAGELDSFVMPYLGNQDRALPVQPVDLVRREDVMDYPTDFSPMSQTDLDRIALRGEQLTRLLLAHYCPDL